MKLNKLYNMFLDIGLETPIILFLLTECKVIEFNTLNEALDKYANREIKSFSYKDTLRVFLY